MALDKTKIYSNSASFSLLCSTFSLSHPIFSSFFYLFSSFSVLFIPSSYLHPFDLFPLHFSHFLPLLILHSSSFHLFCILFPFHFSSLSSSLSLSLFFIFFVFCLYCPSGFISSSYAISSLSLFSPMSSFLTGQLFQLFFSFRTLLFNQSCFTVYSSSFSSSFFYTYILSSSNFSYLVSLTHRTDRS